MPAVPHPHSPAGTILGLLAEKLNAIEAELKRLGWWSAEPPNLQAEIAAGRLKSWLDAPSFELWLQCVFIPNARTRIAEADLPSSSSVGEMARREYDYHSTVPEAAPLLALLREFDGLIEAWHFHRTAEVDPPPNETSAPPLEPAGRPHLTPADGTPLDYANILLAKKSELQTTLTEIEQDAAAHLEQDANKTDATLQWLAGDFPASVRQWLSRGQVPQESRIATVAEAEWKQHDRAGLLVKLKNFDAQVAAWHTLSRTLETESAHGRLLAAWQCIMAPSPALEKTIAPAQDTVRTWILLTLNRIEAELRFAGWWSDPPPPLPPEFTNTINYAAGHRDRSVLPPYHHWLQSSLIPALRARIQAGEIPDDVKYMADDANRALSEERLGPDKFKETRPLYRAMDDLQTLLTRTRTAALQHDQNPARLRGLTPPPSGAAERAAKELTTFRTDLSETIQRVHTALEAPLWQNPNISQNPPPFEHWLRTVYIPDLTERLEDGRPLEERRIFDFASRECRLLDLTAAAEKLLTALERIDNWSHLANRALRDQWEAG